MIKELGLFVVRRRKLRRLLNQRNKKLLILLILTSGIVLIASFQQSIFIQGAIIFSLLALSAYLLESRYEQNGTYHKLLHQLTVPALIISNQNIKKINSLALEILQSQSADQLIGSSVSDFFYMNNKGMIIGKNRDICKLKTCKGQSLEVELLVIKIDDQETYLIMLIERTELVEYRDKLQHIDQLSSIGELAAGIAHEIRNPITSLKGFLQLIDQNNSDEKAYTGIMLSEIDRINSIVSELLLIAKPRGMVLKDKNIIEIIKTVITLASTQAILYNIEIKLSLYDSNASGIFVKCDENKLKQVFINLIRNAIEAMQKEGTIYVKINREVDRVIICVIDEGEGIPKERLLKLGKQFFSTKEGGTGLGVMISSKIVEDHGGIFQIESKEGKGTEIRITLPI